MEFIACSTVVQLGAAPSASSGRADRSVLWLGTGPLLSYIGAGEQQNGMKQLCSCSTNHANRLCSVNDIVGCCFDG